MSRALLGKKLLAAKKYKIYPSARFMILLYNIEKGEMKTHKLNSTGKDYFYVKIVLF